jgi:hypothetical protein
VAAEEVDGAVEQEVAAAHEVMHQPEEEMLSLQCLAQLPREHRKLLTVHAEVEQAPEVAARHPRHPQTSRRIAAFYWISSLLRIR